MYKGLGFTEGSITTIGAKMAYLGYLLCVSITTLAVKESSGLDGAGPAPIIYLKPTASEITDNANTDTVSTAAGTLGKIAYSNFGGTPTYFYIRSGAVDMQVGGVTTNILNDGGASVVDIAACCGRLFAVQRVGDKSFAIAVYFKDFTYRLFPLTKRRCTPRIAVDCNNRVLYFTTDNGINQWDFTDINLNEVAVFSTNLNNPFPHDPTFGSCPLDLAHAEEGENPILYFTLMNSAKVFQATLGSAIALFKDFTDHGAVTFITADTNRLYYGSRTGADHAIYSQSRSAPGDAAVQIQAATEISGITVCEGGCAETCPTSCTTCEGDCGLCLPAAGAVAGTCVCTYVPQVRCTYSGETVPAGCINGPVPEDLMCVVVNPVSERKPPARDIKIHAIFDTGPQGEFVGATYSTRIRRRVRTGQLPPPALPRNAFVIKYDDPHRKAVVFTAQPKARGQRFGVFAAQMLQSNGRDQGSVFSEALCIAQDKSELYSPVYTVIASPEDGDVVLKAYVTNDHLARIRWCRTDLQTGVRVNIMEGIGQRAITVANNPSNTGIYQAYVEGRFPRTWHAIIYVIIRRCSLMSHGADCGGSCSCIATRGVCDETSGSCRCFAGYQGEDCDEPCPAGMVGQGCNINCEEEFGEPGCRNTLFCSPYPVGCHCYQEDNAAKGLQPPYCACPAGKYGPNCEKTCACTATEICDAICGCIDDCINRDCLTRSSMSPGETRCSRVTPDVENDVSRRRIY